MNPKPTPPALKTKAIPLNPFKRQYAPKNTNTNRWYEDNQIETSDITRKKQSDSWSPSKKPVV
jgi:hypothetical protein